MIDVKISENGILPVTVSNENTIDPETLRYVTIKGDKGDKGDTGDSGVRFSDTQPTDDNVNIWIDPDGSYDEPSVKEQIDEAMATVREDISVIQRDISDLKYTPIVITSFSCTPNVAEIGSTVTAVLFSWGINKKPSTLTLDGAVLDNSAASTRVDELKLTANKTWTLRAVDERGTEATATTTLTFLNGVYYGVGVVPDSIDSSFILGLTKTLRGAKLGSFTVNAGDGQYIWYCVPSRFGTCSFKVGGFDGGFDRVAVMDFTNASGYTESYDVYRSANAGLGNTKVGVT